MDRRQFLRLTVGTVVVLPVGTFLVSCSGYGAGDTSSVTGNGHPPAAPPRQLGSEVVYTTSLTSGHSHTFAVESADFASPPAAGVSGATSVDLGHSHAVSVSMAMLEGVAAGQSVEVIAAAGSSGHTHVLTLVKLGAGSSADAGPPSGGGEDAGGTYDPGGGYY